VNTVRVRIHNGNAALEWLRGELTKSAIVAVALLAAGWLGRRGAGHFDPVA